MSGRRKRDEEDEDEDRQKSKRLELTYTAILLSIGLLWGLFAHIAGQKLPLWDQLMIAVLLFGVIEIPRIEKVSNNTVRLILTTLLVGQAVLYIMVSQPGMVSQGATTALLFLFFGTMIATWERQESSAFRATMKEHAGYYAAFGAGGGIAYLAHIGAF